MQQGNATGAPGEIWLGLDTGGTFTDAVALRERRVIASAKALTTHWDLSVGLAEAIRAVLGKLPPVERRHVALVSVSTTLATNAVIESRFSPICTLLIGFDEPMLERSGLKRAGGIVVRVRGGHEATGDESEPLEESAIDAAVRQFAAQVEAFAVAGMFSVRNPTHERQARERIRALCDKPVTCSFELSSQLDAPKRALTAALNARLTPQIRHLLDALAQVLEREAVSAPVMVVRGDGTLIRGEVALEYPVETVLSGPAASVVGAGFISGLADFAVADMGGTTTDVAIVTGGRPVVRPEGAVLGGWRTMVTAIDVHTCGLGGDSEVYFDREARLRVGPRRALPLSLLATRFPGVVAELRKLAGSERLPPFAARFAFRNPGRDPGAQLDRLEQRVWEALSPAPRPLGDVARTAVGVDAVRRLVDRGVATLAAFTPTDALHVLARQCDWSAEAAHLGAAVLAIEERNMRARMQADSPESFAERIYQHVVREATRAVLECALAQDPGVEPQHGRWARSGGCSRMSWRDTPSPECWTRPSASRLRWSRSVHRRRPITRRSRSVSTRGCWYRSTRRCATPSGLSPVSFPRPARCWSINPRSTCSGCTIRPVTATIRTRMLRSRTRDVSRASSPSRPRGALERATHTWRRSSASGAHRPAATRKWIISLRQWCAHGLPAGPAAAARHRPRSRG